MFTQAEFNQAAALWVQHHPGSKYPGSAGTMQNYMWYDFKSAKLTPNPAEPFFSYHGTLLPKEGNTVLESIYWTDPKIPDSWKSVGSVVATCNDSWELSWSSKAKDEVSASYTTSGYQ
jgi:hypothetical protein